MNLERLENQLRLSFNSAEERRMWLNIFKAFVIDLEKKIALAEPEEGEENIKELIEKLPADAKKALARVIKGCSPPDQPLKFGEGDLVIGIAGSEKDRKAVFQSYPKHTKKWCWVLDVDSDDTLAASYWLVENIRLVEPRRFVAFLRIIKNKLTGKNVA